jgi:predicted glycoside hydrolase/deacetylase ChbG (UPF0249 family)
MATLEGLKSILLPYCSGSSKDSTGGSSTGGVYETITDAGGAFFKLGVFEEKARSINVDAGEVEAEFDAQIKKIIAAGIEPDHFDSHHHVHNLPCVAEAYLKLARKYGVKARRCNVPNYGIDTGGSHGGVAMSSSHGATATEEPHGGVATTEAFSDAFYNEMATLEGLKSILLPYCSGSSDNRNLGCASIEIMSHPAFVDYDLHNRSRYCMERVYELQILTCDDLKGFISVNGFELCSFSSL